MSEAATKPSSGTVIVRTIVGIALMVGGMFVSKQFAEQFKTIEAQFGVPLDLGKTVATIGVLLIIFPVIQIFFIDPLRNAIAERNTNLENTFSEAESLRSQMETMKRDYEARLQAAESQAREQIQNSIREAQALRQTLMAEATEKADEMVRRAQEEIESEKQKVLTELRVGVVNLALAAAEKVVGENMDTDKNRKLVTEFIDNVEVAR